MCLGLVVARASFNLAVVLALILFIKFCIFCIFEVYSFSNFFAVV